MNHNEHKTNKKKFLLNIKNLYELGESVWS